MRENNTKVSELVRSTRKRGIPHSVDTFGLIDVALCRLFLLEMPLDVRALRSNFRWSRHHT